MAINGIEEINGEDCYELFCGFPQYGNYEITWFVSVRDFLPRARTITYPTKDGKRGGYIQTLSNIEINKHSNPDLFKIKDLNN